jgi:hypothetical protein
MRFAQLARRGYFSRCPYHDDHPFALPPDIELSIDDVKEEI